MGRMSARRIGAFLGMTAMEVNRKLKEVGLLEGEPGAYGVTDKGEEYGGEDHYNENGYGGYAHRDWETRTWLSSVITAISKWDLHRYDWYCDNCKTQMNDQSGFEDAEDTWDCGECGSKNDVGPSNLR